MTYEIFQSKDPANYSSWLQWDSAQQNWLISDPNTGLHVPDMPPSLILENESLAAGLNYLRLNSHRLKIEILYGSHECAEDLDISQGPRFEQRVAAADLVMYETGIDWKDTWSQAILDRVDNNLPLDGISPFFRRLFVTIAQHKKPSYSFDVSATQPQNYPDYVVSSLYDSPEEAPDAEQIIVADHIREWYKVANIGRRLMQAEACCLVKPEISILLTEGVMHRDITRKLGLQGLDVQETIMDTATQIDPRLVELHVNAIKTATISGRV
jgi:hypothetical protein